MAERRHAPQKNAVLSPITLPGRANGKEQDGDTSDRQPLQEKIEKSVRV